MKIYPQKFVGYTIVQIRNLGGRMVKKPYVDPTHFFSHKREAQKELAGYGMPQDFKVVKIQVLGLPLSKSE